MPKRWLSRGLKALLVSIAVVLPISATVLAYVFSAPLAVTNNGSAYDMLPVTVSAPTTWLVNNGYIDADGLDTRVQTQAGSIKPHMLSNNRLLTAIPAPATSQTNLLFTTGDTSLDSFQTIVGYGGNVTASDDATIELGANWTALVEGWIDTTVGANKNLIIKEDAFTCNISGATDITSTVEGYAIAETLDTAGAGDETNLGVAGAATNWQAVSSDDADTSYVFTAGGWTRDLYDIGQVTPAWGVISNVTVYAKARNTVAGVSGLKIAVRTHATTYETAAKAITTAYAVYSEVYAVNPNTTAAWTWEEVNALEIGVSLFATGTGGATRATFVYAVVNAISPEASVTATGITSEEYEARTTESAGLDFISANGDFAEVLYHADFDVSAISIEGWFNKDNTGTDYIISRLYNGQWAIAVDTKITVKAHVGGVYQSSHAVTGAVISANTWYHFVWTYDGTTSHIYLNGQDLVITQNGNGVLGTGAHRIWIGKRYDDGAGLWDGIIDQIRFYGRVLTPTEVTEHYAGIYTDETDLVASWQMDDFAGVTLTDSSGNAHHGTITGADWHMGALRLYIDDILEDIATGAVVLNNANDYYFMTNNSVAYADNISISVNNVQQLWYQPNDIISGTTLPDRADATANDGTIAWGSNPTGVAVTLGSLASVAQPSLADIGDEPARDLLPEIEASDWFVEPAVTGTLLTNPLRPLITIVSDNTTLTELQTWRFFGLALVLLVTVGVARAVPKHLAIACIAGGASTVAMVVFTIFPLWALVFLVLYAFGGWVSERSPSL